MQLRRRPRRRCSVGEQQGPVAVPEERGALPELALARGPPRCGRTEEQALEQEAEGPAALHLKLRSSHSLGVPVVPGAVPRRVREGEFPVSPVDSLDVGRPREVRAVLDRTDPCAEHRARAVIQ